MPAPRRPGREPAVVRMVRDLTRAGLSQSSIREQAREAFPGFNARRLSTIMREERESTRIIDRVQAHHWGAFADIPALVGCSPGTTRLRVTISTPVTNPITGAEQRFSHMTTVPIGRRVGDMLSAAYQGVLAEARRLGYAAAGEGRFTRDLLSNSTIEFIECV